MSTVRALTVEEFKDALPDKVKKSVNQALIDQINTTFSDPDMYEYYRDNLLSYGKVMAEGKFRIEQYLSAIKYASFKLMGKTNIDAFTLTFPDKIKNWGLQGIAGKDQASYVTAYNKSKLVQLLLEQSLTPFWLLNQDVRQKALNVQADLMVSANSEKVRTDAANSVLTHLKQPEKQSIEMNVTTNDGGVIEKLRQVTLDLVSEQRKQLLAGQVNAQEVAHSRIFDVTPEEV